MIDDDPGTLQGLGGILRLAGHDVATASSGIRGDRSPRTPADGSRALGSPAAGHVRPGDSPVPPSPRPAHHRALRHGHGVRQHARRGDRDAARRGGILEKPVWEDGLLRTVETALARPPCRCKSVPCDDNAPTVQQAHAAARWARVVVPVLDAPEDPRTIKAWSRLLYVSPGALRNWCRTAGITPRRSLVFARLLRAVFLSDGGRHKPENLLDVVD